jgi:DNA topoisomerase-1
VKALEEKGVGRPSTYAAILSTIQEKEYATKEKGRFFTTRLGEIVNELLVGNFPEILDVGFTAQMEDELDDVEEGKRGWVDVLNDFYGPFSKTLERAKQKMKDVKRQEIETAFKCEMCGSVMVIKWGKRGEFLACSAYPKCKNTKEFRMDHEGNISVMEAKKSSEKCPKCGSAMVVKHGRFGEFLACSAYPTCKSTKPISIGVKCPECGGDLVQRRSKRGRYFYGCGNYPRCNFALWNKPVAEACPKCKNPYLVEKLSKKDGDVVACPNKDCTYKRSIVG